jgi:hypothetical protein
VSLRYKDRASGDLYVPSEYDGKYRVMLEVDSIEDFRMFAKIAHSARLTKVGKSEKNMQSFENLEEII